MRILARPFLTLLLLVALAPGARAVEWKTWNAGLAAAASSRRPVIVDVYTDWCRWCRQMDREVYGRADVSGYLAAKFVAVKLNAEGVRPPRTREGWYRGWDA